MVVLLSYGHLALKHIIHKLIKTISNNAQIRPEAKFKIKQILVSFQAGLPFAQSLNLSVFYLTGIYYHMSKRISSIKYLKIKSTTFNGHKPTFKLLGSVSLANLAISLILASYKSLGSSNHVQNSTGEEETCFAQGKPLTIGNQCTLCLDLRRNSSCTPCGHLFCWDCILESLNNREECPLCREPVKPSRVVPMRNYD